MFKKIFELLTENDNATLNPAHFWSAVSIVAAIGLEMFNVLKLGHPFSITDFGQGIGLLLAGLGVSRGLTSNSFNIGGSNANQSTTSKRGPEFK